MAPERNNSVARLTIGAYFQLWTGTTARPSRFRQTSRLLEFNQIQQQRFFTKDMPSSRERLEHRLAVQCRWRTNIDKIDLYVCGQVINRGKRGHV